MASERARFRRAHRLRDARDYRRLAAGGRRAASRNYVILTVQRATPASARLGITASRRVGGAVERNRVKRVIREWFRRHRAKLPANLDVVVIARAGAVVLDSREASGELSRLIGEAAG